MTKKIQHNGELIRTARFFDQGECFTLKLYWLHARDELGKERLGYRLISRGRDIFKGEDFACSPLHGIDSNETVACLMGFLTLREGDTDAEYFASYTPEQWEFSRVHGESLGSTVSNRYGEL